MFTHRGEWKVWRNTNGAHVFQHRLPLHFNHRHISRIWLRHRHGVVYENCRRCFKSTFLDHVLHILDCVVLFLSHVVGVLRSVNWTCFTYNVHCYRLNKTNDLQRGDSGGDGGDWGYFWQCLEWDMYYKHVLSFLDAIVLITQSTPILIAMICHFIPHETIKKTFIIYALVTVNRASSISSYGNVAWIVYFFCSVQSFIAFTIIS